MNPKLTICTFGSFRVSGSLQHSAIVKSKQNKMWSVLKYLIAFYGKPVTVGRLAEILGDTDDYDDPIKILRNIIYRLRKTLVAYGGEHEYILFDKGSYTLNRDIDCWIDVLEFNKLLGQARDIANPFERRADLYNAAIDLYNGPFLVDSANEIWTLPFTDHYSRIFLQAVAELADLYERQSMFDEIVTLYGKAIARDPYEESLYVKQIQTLINNGEYASARQHYRLFEKLLMREFGAKPSPNLARLFYEADKAAINEPGNLEEVTQLLEAGNKRHGALFCGAETFKQIYALDKRAEERVQFPIFLALVTVVLLPDIEQDREDYELKSAMKILRKVLVTSLRSGDVIAQYSKSQFTLMLTALNKESGQAALRRMKYLFENKFGKDKGQLTYILSPIGKDQEENLNSEKKEAENKEPQPHEKG